ncbi:MAG TPA: phage major capsid protein [Burkholderiaceae bacterium]|nr:phage major capsid protein [Burkholderiaceae bacterium]
MESIQDLRERRALKATESRKLIEAHKGEHLPADVGDKVDAIYNEIEAIDRSITLIERQQEVDAAEVIQKRDPGAQAPDSAANLFDKWLRGGDAALSAAEWQKIRATMSTTTGSEGGYTVPSLIASQLYDSMKAFGAMRAVAEIIRTADGRPLSFPTSDGTSETGEWIGQNTTATAADPTFGTKTLNVFKASSKIVAAPFELLQDATIDMEAFIRGRLAQRLGRLGNTGFTVGTGTTQPDGVVPQASSGKVGTTGQTLTIIYDDIVDLIHAVDPAYRGPGCAFMTNDALLKVIRKLKDSQNMPLWLPNRNAGIGVANGTRGGYSAQDQATVFDTLLGYPVYVNNDIATPAANAKTMLFGDFSYYKIRDAMEVQMFRFTDSAYTKLGQVAFLAWCRMGGNLVDTAAVKYYAHSAT